MPCLFGAHSAITVPSNGAGVIDAGGKRPINTFDGRRWQRKRKRALIHQVAIDIGRDGVVMEMNIDEVKFLSCHGCLVVGNKSKVEKLGDDGNLQGRSESMG